MNKQKALELKNITFEKGAYITIEGEPNADMFYIVRDSKVHILRAVQATDERGSIVISAGGVFGVVSAMAGYGKHVETSRAVTDVKLIAVRRDQFAAFIRTNPTVALKIMLQFSERMRELNIALTGNPPKIKTGGMKNDAPKNDRQKSSDEKKFGESLKTYKKDDIIFLEGDLCNEVFIVKSGQVKISKMTQTGETLLAILNPDSIFGEMAPLGSSPRTATAAAYTDCQVLVLEREKFLHMIRTEPQMIERLTVQLAERIWLLYKQLANSLVPDPAGKLFDMLLVNLEKRRVDLSSQGSYRFDFGTKELVEMTGIAGNTDAAVAKLLQNRYVIVTPFGTLSIQNVIEFVRQAKYFRDMQKTYQSVLKALPK